MQVFAIISAVAALLLVITSSIVLNEAYMEFSTSESALSTSSTADHRREREEYNFRVGILAAEVRRKETHYNKQQTKKYNYHVSLNIFYSQIAAGLCTVIASVLSSSLTCSPLCCRAGWSLLISC